MSQLSFDEIVALELSKLTKTDVAVLTSLKRDELTQLHHWYGQALRNEYQLWHTSPLTKRWREDPSSRDIRQGIDYSDDHPDSVSMKLIEAIWDRLNAPNPPLKTAHKAFK